MEDVSDLLNEVNQQLADDGERDEDQVDYPLTSSPGQPTEPHVKFSTPSPSKRSMVCQSTDGSTCCLQSITVPDRCFLLQFSPKTPPFWAEDHKSLLQMLCQQVESLKVSRRSTTWNGISHFLFRLFWSLIYGFVMEACWHLHSSAEICTHACAPNKSHKIQLETGKWKYFVRHGSTRARQRY